jgi:hypothetical protein
MRGKYVSLQSGLGCKPLRARTARTYWRGRNARLA